MSIDLNNQYIGTESQKLRRISPIKNYLIDSINNNQNIKRLCRYMTTTPLLNKGKTYDGEIVSQPDLVDSLLHPATKDTQATIKDTVLVPYAFSDDIVSEKKVSVYAYSPKTLIDTSYRGRHHDIVCRHLFVVEVVYPQEYDRIEPYGDERSNLIACEILNMFDNHYISGELRELVGDCQFKIEGEISDLRLSKAGYMITTIPIWVSFIGVRTSEREEM